jgi:hypothetical protein
MNCLQQRFAIQFFGMGILPVPVLLAGNLARTTRNFGYFFNWKSLKRDYKKQKIY